MDEEHRRAAMQATGDTVGRAPQRRPAGALAVRRERRADMLVLWLSGTLDRATSGLLDREFDAQPGQRPRLVVDLTGLEFIDSHGLETLARTQRRACASDQRLTFRQGLHVSQRPLELTHHLQLRSRLAARRASSSSNDYFSMPTIARGDVDRPRPRSQDSDREPEQTPHV